MSAVTTTITIPRRLAGGLSLVQGLLFFIPLLVLGAAIGWPGTLDDPPTVLLPAIAEQATAVRLGYLAYLAYSILFGAAVIALLPLVEDHLSPTAVRIAAGFAIASVVARCIGIVRWLAPMPALADAYVDADPGTRTAIETVYLGLNAYGGTIGEALGVGLFAAISLAALGVGLLRSPTPRVLAVGALVAAAALAVSAADLAGVDLGAFLSVAVTIVQVWFLAIGGWLLVTARSRG